MGQPPAVFETAASTFPPLRLSKQRVYPKIDGPSNLVPLQTIGEPRSQLLIDLKNRLVGWGRCLWPAASGLLAGGGWLPGDLVLRAVSTRDRWGERSTGPTSPHRPEFDEQALIAAAQRGDLPSFNQLVLHYQGLAYNVAYRIVGDQDSAADATQDAFVKAFQRLDQYRGGSFKSWLLRIITNTCYDVLRARKRRPTSTLEHDDEDTESDPDYDPRLIDSAERPDAYVIRQELASVIQAAIGQLPADQRATLVLADIEGLDYQEIADATGAALGTVKSRLSRARARLRDILMAQQELLPARYRLSDS